MLTKVVANQRAPAYGMYANDLKKASEELEEFEKLTFEEKYAKASASDSGVDVQEVIDELDEALEQAAESGKTYEDKIKDEFVKKRTIDEYKKILRSQIAELGSSRLKQIYDTESPALSTQSVKQRFLDRDILKPVDLSLYFETVPSKKVSETGDTASFLKSLLDFYTNQSERREVTTRGLDLKKSILRIHVYDENSTMNPDIAFYGTEFVNSNGQPDSETLANLNSYTFVKDLLMSYHPTIIHGSSTGVVNSISVSAGTSGVVSRTFLVESYAQNSSRESEGDEGDDGFDETVMLPTTLTLDMMGFPMLARGQQIFVDFGTQTSLDNLYQVKTIDHTIEAGSFKTSAVLVPTNQMIVTSFRNRLQTLAVKLLEG